VADRKGDDPEKIELQKASPRNFCGEGGETVGLSGRKKTIEGPGGGQGEKGLDHRHP